MKQLIIAVLIGFTLVSCSSQSANYSTWIEMERCTSYSYALVFEGGESSTVSNCTNWEVYRVRRR